MRAGDGTQGGEADAHRDRAPGTLLGAQTTTHAVGQVTERLAHELGFGFAAAERRLRAHRPGSASGRDLAVVEVGGQRAGLGAQGAPEERLQRVARRGGELGDGVDALLGQLLLGDRPDAPDEADRQRVEELALAIGWHHHQSIGLGHLRGDLGEVLRARGSDRDGQAHLGAHALADAGGDVLGWPEEVHGPADVEERLVDGDALDQWREVAEYRHHLVGQALVVAEVPAHEREVGAQLLRPPSRHAALHPEALRLVRGSEHHAAADGDGHAAQIGLQQLLDGRIERVEVGVEDGGTGGHPGSLGEHVFVTQECSARTVAAAGVSPVAAACPPNSRRSAAASTNGTSAGDRNSTWRAFHWGRNLALKR